MLTKRLSRAFRGSDFSFHYFIGTNFSIFVICAFTLEDGAKTHNTCVVMIECVLPSSLFAFNIFTAFLLGLFWILKSANVFLRLQNKCLNFSDKVIYDVTHFATTKQVSFKTLLYTPPDAIKIKCTPLKMK